MESGGLEGPSAGSHQQQDAGLLDSGGWQGQPHGLQGAGALCASLATLSASDSTDEASSSSRLCTRRASPLSSCSSTSPRRLAAGRGILICTQHSAAGTASPQGRRRQRCCP